MLMRIFAAHNSTTHVELTSEIRTQNSFQLISTCTSNNYHLRSTAKLLQLVTGKPTQWTLPLLPTIFCFVSLYFHKLSNHHAWEQEGNQGQGRQDWTGRGSGRWPQGPPLGATLFLTWLTWDSWEKLHRSLTPVSFKWLTTWRRQPLNRKGQLLLTLSRRSTRLRW